MLEHTPRIPVALCVALVTMGAPTSAGADKVRLSGVVRAGYEVEERIGPEAEAELKVVTKRARGTRAVLKLEARYFRDDVDVEDAYLDHKFSDRVRLQFGVNKKRLGMEYQQSNRERMTPKRSLIYRKLEGLGLVGRQLNLRAVTEPVDDLSLDVLVGTDGARNANMAVHVAREHGDVGYGYWGLVEAHRVDKDYIPVTAHALGAWLISDDVRAVAELIGGVDSFETETNMLFGDGERVWFAGPKVELAYRFALGTSAAIEPVLQGSWVAHDLASPGHNSLQVLAGLNVYYRELVMSANVEQLSTTERAAPHMRTTGRPNVYVRVKLHF